MTPDLNEPAEREQAIAELVSFYEGKWPPWITSGVMFWKGKRITYPEFRLAASKAKRWGNRAALAPEAGG